MRSSKRANARALQRTPAALFSIRSFLDQLAKNPQHKEVRAFLRWAGEDFDPNEFDRYAANAALLRMAWNQWGKA